jgi:hypothetical protein
MGASSELGPPARTFVNWKVEVALTTVSCLVRIWALISRYLLCGSSIQLYSFLNLPQTNNHSNQVRGLYSVLCSAQTLESLQSSWWNLLTPSSAAMHLLCDTLQGIASPPPDVSHLNVHRDPGAILAAMRLKQYNLSYK